MQQIPPALGALLTRSTASQTEEWDGLPYPQIMALPTFKYAVRERTEEMTTTSKDPTYNTLYVANRWIPVVL